MPSLDKTTIYLVGPYPPPFGGVSVHNKRLRMALDDKGYRARVLAQADLASDDPAVSSISLGQIWKPFWSGITQSRPIVHYHSSGVIPKHFILLTLLASFKFPVIITFHSFRQDTSAIMKPCRTLLRLSLRFFSHIICVGSGILDQILDLGVDRKKISVIPSYIPPILNDSDRYRIPHVIQEFINNHHPILTANAYKLVFHEGEDLYGLDMCIELCRQLKENYPEVGFVFALPDIGDEEYYNLLLKRIKEYDLVSAFWFSREPIEYWPIIERSTIFLRPTNTDSFGISVAEAIDLGVPAIASDVCERPQGTILFRRRDAEDLRAKVEAVLTSLEDDIVTNSRPKFGKGIVVDQIEGIYQSAMNELS